MTLGIGGGGRESKSSFKLVQKQWILWINFLKMKAAVTGWFLTLSPEIIMENKNDNDILMTWL